MAAPKKADVGAIEVPNINIAEFELRIIGTAPLVVHKWSEKAKEMIRAKQQKRANAGREARDPEAEYNAARYIIDEVAGIDGFPVVAFKAAAVDACTQLAGVTKVLARGAFHVNLGQELVPIEGDKAKMREDVVRLAGPGQPADLRYRPEYTEWSVTLRVQHNTAALSREQIVNLFNVAGFSVGVGEGRPQRNGSWGMFRAEVVTQAVPAS